MFFISKFCSKCGYKNKDNAQFCKKCGNHFDSVKSNNIETKTENKPKKNNNVLIIAIAIIVCVAIIASAFVLLNTDIIGTNDSTALENNSSDVNNIDSSNTNETKKSWKLIDTYTGAGTGVETHNLPEGKLKIKAYAFPLKNYGTNYMHVTIPQEKDISLEWDSHSAVASKSKATSFDSDGSNAFTIDYEELDNWEVDVYQYS